MDHLGRLQVGLVDPSGIAAAESVATITRDMMLSDPKVQNLPATTASASVQFGLNHAVQDGLSAALDDAARAKYSARYATQQDSTAASGTAYATNKPLYHVSMSAAAPREVDVLASVPGTALPAVSLQGYVDEIVADRAPNLRVITVRLAGLELYSLKLGAVVTVVHPRFGMSAGIKARVMSIRVDLVEDAIDLTLLAQVTPDYSTAVHV